MARHPSVQSHSVADAIAQLLDKSTLSALVHGGLLVVLASVFVGFLGFADYLGWRRLRVRFGAVFYACGVGCMIGAALINGFVVTYLATKYAGQPEATLESLKPTLVLCHAMNQTLAQAGTVALSIAILAWSLVLFERSNAARTIAGLGLAVGALPLAGIFSGHLSLDVHGMGVVILMQAIWNVAVGIWLMRQ